MNCGYVIGLLKANNGLIYDTLESYAEFDSINSISRRNYPLNTQTLSSYSTKLSISKHCVSFTFLRRSLTIIIQQYIVLRYIKFTQKYFYSNCNFRMLTKFIFCLDYYQFCYSNLMFICLRNPNSLKIKTMMVS